MLSALSPKLSLARFRYVTPFFLSNNTAARALTYGKRTRSLNFDRSAQHDFSRSPHLPRTPFLTVTFAMSSGPLSNSAGTSKLSQITNWHYKKHSHTIRSTVWLLPSFLRRHLFSHSSATHVLPRQRNGVDCYSWQKPTLRFTLAHFRFGGIGLWPLQ